MKEFIELLKKASTPVAEEEDGKKSPAVAGDGGSHSATESDDDASEGMGDRMGTTGEIAPIGGASVVEEDVLKLGGDIAPDAE